MPLDLNNQLDFARATGGNVAALLQELVRRSPEEWDLKEGSYNGVRFHVLEGGEYDAGLEQVSDSGGRRKARYVFPYKDGQTTEDLGRQPFDFQMNILFHGDNYLFGLTQLLREFDQPTPGDLVHPIRGQLQVAVEEYDIVYKSDTRKAAALNVTFTEHNFTIGEFTSDLENTVKGTLARALDAFQDIQSAIANIQGALIFANNIKQRVTGLLDSFSNNSASTLQRMNQAFNTEGSADIPTLLPSDRGGTPQGGTFNDVITPNDPFAQVPLEELETETATAVTVEQLKDEVNQRRQEVENIINEIENAPVVGGFNTSGSLEFYNDILNLKQTAIRYQEALEAGIRSSQAQVLEFEVPYTMSLREAAFLNDLTPESSREIAILNPELDSINKVDAGTILRIPVS